MKITLATLAAFVAFTSAAIVEDPVLGPGPDGQPLPLDLNSAEIKWSQADNRPVYLFLANYMDSKYPPECISIAKSIDPSSGQYMIPAGSINCSVSGGSGYQFRLSYEDNCCSIQAQNNKPFNVAPYTPSDPTACGSRTC